MKAIGVIVLAVVAFNNFTGIICNPVDTEIEDEEPQDDCQGFGEMCTREYKPICGSDAVTYSNKCTFCKAKKGKAELLMVSEGECEPKDEEPQDDCQGFTEMCTREYKPICGSDAVTYSNKCTFCNAKKGKADLLFVSEGECEPKEEPPQDDCQGFGDMCTMDYRPVCGSDAKTYPNKCSFCKTKKGKAELLMVSEGECKQKEEPPQDDCQGFGDMCTMDYRPVCGSDAKTYPNKCSFCNTKKGKAELLMVSEGECKQKEELPQDDCQGFGDMCTMDYKPVCGSDAKTYPNKCYFCNTKKGKADLMIVSEGECEPEDECDGFGNICPDIYSPVCGSDAVTYDSKCSFCNAKKQKADILIVSEGECEPEDECEGFGNICPDIFSPVCGSDAVTYDSKCSFCNAKKQKADLLIVSEGECEPEDECEGFGNMCPTIYSPVCGSDAVSYDNKCILCNAKKTKAGLTLVSVGECQKESY